VTTDQTADSESDQNKTAPARQQSAEGETQVRLAQLAIEGGVTDSTAKTIRFCAIVYGNALIQRMTRIVVGISISCFAGTAGVVLSDGEVLSDGAQVRASAAIILGLGALLGGVVLVLALLRRRRRRRHGEPTQPDPAETPAAEKLGGKAKRRPTQQSKRRKKSKRRR
jgi:hypothetical protein